jgi:SAM-dependent methyltransferase
VKANIYQLMRALEEEHWWFVARREILAALLSTVDIPAQADILEVGCGTGGNIDMLLRFGNLVCVEQDEFAAQLARERNCVSVLSGKLPDDLPQLNTSFDLVTLFDVIEHVDEDRQSLVTLSSILNPGGRIIVTVPAFNFLWSQHDDENNHKRRYRKRDLRKLADETGLSLDYISYFNFWLFSPVAAVRLLRKVIPYNESWQDMRQPGVTTNWLLKNILASERYFAGRISLPFGISLMAVFSRK